MYIPDDKVKEIIREIKTKIPEIYHPRLKFNTNFADGLNNYLVKILYLHPLQVSQGENPEIVPVLKEAAPQIGFDESAISVAEGELSKINRGGKVSQETVDAFCALITFIHDKYGPPVKYKEVGMYFLKKNELKPQIKKYASWVLHPRSLLEICFGKEELLAEVEEACSDQRFPNDLPTLRKHIMEDAIEYLGHGRTLKNMSKYYRFPVTLLDIFAERVGEVFREAPDMLDKFSVTGRKMLHKEPEVVTGNRQILSVREGEADLPTEVTLTRIISRGSRYFCAINHGEYQQAVAFISRESFDNVAAGIVREIGDKTNHYDIHKAIISYKRSVTELYLGNEERLDNDSLIIP